ncbi:MULTISPECIES: trans-sulfuration enzyme family protein [Pseudofrankia]|uniref:trans-sulfuration enzyme family protein n=1 Tax=Pseudofrankia TaxID=2994363 RepID=UPI000234D61F|nr:MULTISPECIES: aminotransferase class I/II-fold pyridoxal phosphate-dependent enzyme [Pseudofrankia]
MTGEQRNSEQRNPRRRNPEPAAARNWADITRLIHPDWHDDPIGEPLNPPIFQTSTYRLPADERAAEVASAVSPARFYTRYGSPNARACEEMLRELDGAEAALLVGSGMAAVSAALLSNVSQGDHVVAQTQHYTASLTLLTDVLPRFGVEVSLVEQSDPAALAAAVTDRTRVVYTETPSNPSLVLTDLAAAARAAHDHGALMITDNTFASPFNTRPIELGADLVVQSATKYLGGHSDVTAGVVTGRADLMEAAWQTARVFGPVCHPFEAWLLARGLRTFPLRLARQNSSAQVVAEFLAGHPAVEAVHYPGLVDHPQHELARRQMTGFGGMLSFVVRGGFEAAQGVLRGVDLFVNAVSLGGVESLITHPATLVFSHQTPDEIAAAGVDLGLLRLSIGLEEPADLIADLARALPGQ